MDYTSLPCRKLSSQATKLRINWMKSKNVRLCPHQHQAKGLTIPLQPEGRFPNYYLNFAPLLVQNYY